VTSARIERAGVKMGAGGASQSQRRSSAITGIPQSTNVAAQASPSRNCAMMGIVSPAPAASPIINPSLNNAATRPMRAGNQRRASTGIEVCASVMPRLSSRVKRKSMSDEDQKARRSAPALRSTSPVVTQNRPPMRSIRNPEGRAPTASTSTGRAVSSPVSL